MEIEDEVDSDSSKNGRKNSAASSVNASTSSGQGIPEKVSGRRRTHNSDDVDCENSGISSEKSSDRDDTADNQGKVSFFGPLIKVAASMNPQQFELPPELVEPIPFPGNVNCFTIIVSFILKSNLSIVLSGSSKTCNPKKAGAGPKKKSHELDNGLVPLPLRACFYCSK